MTGLDILGLPAEEVLFFVVVPYIPFLVFNSVLTLLPVVEYDAGAILGPRVGTIPVEDFLYNYSLLSFYGLFYARFRDGSRRREAGRIVPKAGGAVLDAG